MSLLLDALKRAEQAKRGGEEPSEPPARDALSFDQEAQTPPSPNEPATPHVLITRDRLPDISQSLEILADDLPPPLSRRGNKEGRDSSARLGTKDNATAAAQAAARRLFEAKTSTSNPKLPFYFVCGLLGLAAIAGAGYVWYQMQPHSAVPRAAAGTTSASGAHTDTVITPPVQSVAPINSNATAAPADDMIVPSLSASVTSQNQSSRDVSNIDSPPTAAPQRQAATPVARSAVRTSGASITNDTPSFSTGGAKGPSLAEQAYAAFERGDLSAARETYQAAVVQDPLNRDALLGLASLDARSGHYASAEARYLKVLEADPRNPNAQAGLIALRGQSDPTASESRLKNLLAQQPEASFLNFALGNQYAVQSRWSEAQQAYFKAYVADPDNADYAFNLAVSLDHIRQGKAAADYYQKALMFDTAQRGNFNRAQVESRLRELAQ